MGKVQVVINVIGLLAISGIIGFVGGRSSKVEHLEGQVAKLSVRVDALESGKKTTMAPTAGGEDVVGDERLDESAEPVRIRNEAAPTVPVKTTDESAGELDPEDPIVRSQLREIIEEEREIEREERWQRRAKRQEERTREAVRAIAEKTEMDDVVAEQVTDLLVVEQAEAGEIFRQARESMEWDGMRERIGALREETDKEARELLNDEEYTEYQAMREEEERRFRGPGPRGPRGARTGDSE